MESQTKIVEGKDKELSKMERRLRIIGHD